MCCSVEAIQSMWWLKADILSVDLVVLQDKTGTTPATPVAPTTKPAAQKGVVGEKKSG